MEYTYQITGQMTYNDADTESGFCTVDIDDHVTIGEKSPNKALEKFLEENEDFQFFGSLKTCDRESGAVYYDQNENQIIEIKLI